MASILHIMPDIEGIEMTFVQGLIKDMDDNVAQQFAVAYRGRRKDPQTIFIFTLLGFIGIGGIQRFFIGHIGLGLLYLLTCGICFIGTIVDLINYRKLAFEYNQNIAQQVAILVRGAQ